ncbi:MAG: FoF1 ATP synthase subunit delta [Verrucomicrobiota bacterium]|jgi:F-type H+-transporting ATPase subunit delta|nr:F0F1 ATP synthase subunit delta [Verrucomicrobiota bacterium]
MKVSKVAAATARRLFGLCQTGGRLDETKLRTVVARLIESKPRDYRAVLVALQRLTRLEADRRRVTVESAVALDDASRQRVVDGLAKAHGPNLTISYTVNPELIGGLRIRVGNDVLDGSVQGRLTRLANAF